MFAHATSRLGGEVRDYDEAIRELGRSHLEAARATAARRPGWSPSSSCVALAPAEGLLDAAERHDARMIVVGSYGERPLKSALVGSTPTRLLHLSERPVLVVRARRSARRRPQRHGGYDVLQVQERPAPRLRAGPGADRGRAPRA